MKFSEFLRKLILLHNDSHHWNTYFPEKNNLWCCFLFVIHSCNSCFYVLCLMQYEALSFNVHILTVLIKIETWARTKIDTDISIPYFILLSVGHSYEWVQGMLGSGWPHPTGIHQVVIDSLERKKALQIASVALHIPLCSLSSCEMVFIMHSYWRQKLTVYHWMSR